MQDASGLRLSGGARFAVAPATAARRVAGDTVFVELGEGRYFTTDGTGSCVWELITDGRTLDEIIAEVTRRYPEQRGRASADVRDFVQALLQNRLVTRIT